MMETATGDAMKCRIVPTTQSSTQRLYQVADRQANITYGFFGSGNPRGLCRFQRSGFPGHDQLHHQPLLTAAAERVLAVNQFPPVLFDLRDGLGAARLLG